MSKTFASAFLEAQRKKKKKEEEKALQEYIKSYNFVQGMTGSSDTIGTSATVNPPTKATYFDKGAYSDKKTKGKLIKTVIGTTADILDQGDTAVLDATESLIDTTATGVGWVGGFFSKGFKQKTAEFIAKDILKTREDGGIIASYLAPSAPILKAIAGDKTEDWSVLGDKSDSLLQSGAHMVGRQALARLGVPAEVTSGVTAFGQSMEDALRKGATYEQAMGSASISAGAEIVFEKLGGITYGGKGWTDGLKTAFARKVANKVGRALFNLGLDVTTESLEEVATTVVDNIGKKVHDIDGMTWAKVVDKDDILDSAIGGAIFGIAGGGASTINNAAHGRDSITGLTKNEESVVKSIYENRLADKQKDGKKLSGLEKNKLWDDIVTEMKKGELSTDDIERVLGGDTYTEYKSRIDQVENIKKKIDALQTEHDDLNQKLPAEMRGIDNDRLAELKKELPKLKSQYKHWTSDTKAQEVADLKSKLSSEVYALSKGTNLAESYHEIARRKQAFTADLSQYNEKEAAIVQKAIDSGIINNTNRSREFVDLVARLAAAKDLDFDFTTNQRLAESGFSIEGATINGMVDTNTKAVTINMNSAKALETVVGHEITHILENTDLYTPLQEAVKQYATTKGEYKSRLEAIAELYKNEEGADVVKELTADLVGDYIFSDADFVNSLAKGNRNLAQKILDEIKYMAKIATAGSKEKRQLEKAKKMLKDALEKNVDVKATSKIVNTDLSLSPAGTTESGRFMGKDIALEDEVVVEETPKLAPTKSAPTKTTPTRKASVPVDASKVKTTPKTPKAVTVYKDASDGKMRRFVETATQSEVVDGQILPEDLVQGKIYYEPVSNKKTLEKANRSLDRLGYDEAIKHFDNQFNVGKVTLEDIVLGERLIQESLKKGDTVIAGKLIEDVAILGTELGQKVQALSIIQRLTPEGQLRMLNRTIERAKAKLDKQFKGVEITQEMKDRILSVYDADGNYDQDALNEAMDSVIAEIADKMKTTVGDKANAWRYLSMLGNIKTHGRNVISNLANAVTIAGKDVVARTIEAGVDIGAKITGKESPFEYRTKTWKIASRDVLDFAKKTVTEERAHIQGDDTSNIRKRILAKRKMFGKTFFTDLYNLNSKALKGEDWLFSKFAYKNALAEFLTANGIRTQADIDNNKKLVDKAKDYALDRARIATFQQDSWLANKISEIENKNLASKIAVGAVVPFKKTPINVAKAGFNYSPLGVAKTITYDAVRLAKGEITANTYIDNLSQGFTGSALVFVGYLLASKGILNGAGDDDKEGKYDYQLGEQRYSITVGKNTYTLNWLSPTAMPLFVGANMFEQFVEKREFDGNVVLQSIAQVLDPMSDMSFLSSLNDALSSYDSGIMKFVGIFKSMSQNYITQYIPTVLSQTAATFDDTKRTTKASKTSSFRIGDETMRKIMYKIPGLRNMLEPVVDIWGNEVKQDERVIVRALDNYIMPYSKKYGIATNVDTEIKELYKETGDTGLIPSVPYDNISFKGTKYNMSAKQFTRFKQNYGQTAHDLMAKLFETETYKNASLDMQADMVNRVYDYARDEAKRKYLNTQGVTYTNTTEDGKEIYRENYIKGAVDNDMTVEEYKFSVKYPEKYEFFKANGISVDDYNNADDDGKDALNWANKYPEKYMVSKAVTPDLFTYKQYTKALNDIESDKDSDGKSISGSRKKKVADYINGLDIDYGAKCILYKMEFSADDTYNEEIVNYLMSKDDIGYNDMVTILTELGMKVSASGRVSW